MRLGRRPKDDDPHKEMCPDGVRHGRLQPFSQKSRTPTVAKEFQIGLYDPAEADWELFRSSWSAEFFGERLYKSGVGHPMSGL